MFSMAPKASRTRRTDPTNPVNAYGRTKLAGEQAIRSSGVNHLIFRTAWVYSTRGKNFLLTILRLATQREELRIVSDQTGAPTWSREIALATTQVLQRIYNPKQNPPAWHNLGGTYHMTAGGETNWCEFTRAILEEAHKHMQAPAEWITTATRGTPLIARQVMPISTAEYPTPARRPAYSVLSNTRVETVFGIQLPDWQTQLRTVFPTRRPEAVPDLPNYAVRIRPGPANRTLRDLFAIENGTLVIPARGSIIA